MIVLHHKATGRIVRNQTDMTVLVFDSAEAVEAWCDNHNTVPSLFHETKCTMVGCP